MSVSFTPGLISKLVINAAGTPYASFLVQVVDQASNQPLRIYNDAAGLILTSASGYTNTNSAGMLICYAPKGRAAKIVVLDATRKIVDTLYDVTPGDPSDLTSNQGSGGITTLASASDYTTAALATANTSISSGLASKVSTSSVGAVNGVAGLGSDGKVPSGQLPTISSGGGGYTLTSTFTLTDAYSGQMGTSSGASTVTVPTGLALTDIFNFQCSTSAQITLSPASGVTINNEFGHTKSSGAAYGVITLVCTALNTFTLFGSTGL